MGKLLAILVLIGLIYGFYYYHTHQKEAATAMQTASDIKNTVVATTTNGIDTAVKAAIEGVDKISPVYYYQNRSYGKTAADNICTDSTSSTSVGAIVADLQTYTKAVTCTVDPHFPTKSFTITAPSFSNKGQYYCTDQSGFVGLIPSTASGSAFQAGLACN